MQGQELGLAWYRIQIVLLFVAPLLAVAGLYVFGRVLPVPHLGREYVIRIELPEPGTTVGLPEVLGPDDPSRQIGRAHV